MTQLIKRLTKEFLG